MKFLEVLEQVQSHGVVLKTDGGQILYKPKEALPEEVLERLREYKADVIRFLQKSEQRLRVFSRVLGRDITIYWTGDDPKVIYVDRTPYSVEEITKLKGASSQGVRDAHLLKQTFDGEIIGGNDGNPEHQ